MLSCVDADIRVAARYHMEMLCLVYRYLICLFCVGALTTFAMAALIVYQSVLIASQLLF